MKRHLRLLQASKAGTLSFVETEKRIAKAYEDRARHKVALDRCAELLYSNNDELQHSGDMRRGWLAVGTNHAQAVRAANDEIVRLKATVTS